MQALLKHTAAKEHYAKVHTFVCLRSLHAEADMAAERPPAQRTWIIFLVGIILYNLNAFIAVSTSPIILLLSSLPTQARVVNL
jgi:hypothetical protein